MAGGLAVGLTITYPFTFPQGQTVAFEAAGYAEG